MKIIGNDKNVSIYKIINSITKTEDAKDKRSNTTSSQLVNAIINGAPYPHELLILTLLRIKSDIDISPMRASIIKAYLITNKKEKINMSLNKEITNVGYLLGRLFYLIEWTQEVANPNINKTIKNTFLAKASVNPKYIFPNLLKLNSTHLDKIKTGYKIKLESEICEIMEKIDALETDFFPTTLSLEEQGMFFLGYYQQKQDRYEKKRKEQ